MQVLGENKYYRGEGIDPLILQSLSELPSVEKLHLDFNNTHLVMLGFVAEQE